MLEIGAGTGQHAVHFARHLPQVVWQPTEQREWLAIACRARAARGPAQPAHTSRARRDRNAWPLESADVVYTANTLHIMAWPEVEAFFRGVGRVLAPGGFLVIYGPFRFDGDYTSPSNAEFDAYLRRRDPASGIRDFEAVDALAAAEQLQLDANHAMPANNQLLLWRRTRPTPWLPARRSGRRSGHVDSPDDRSVHRCDAQRAQGLDRAGGTGPPVHRPSPGPVAPRPEDAGVSRVSIRTAASRPSSTATRAISPCSSRARS